MRTIIQGLASSAIAATLASAMEIAVAGAAGAPSVEVARPGEVAERAAAPRDTLREEQHLAKPRHEPAARPKSGRKAQRRAAQKRETASRPLYVGGCQGPPVPDEILTNEQTIRVRVRFVVDREGIPRQAEMERSHPMIPDASVIACALRQRFEPARLPNGTAIASPFRRQFNFRVMREAPANAR